MKASILVLGFGIGVASTVGGVLLACGSEASAIDLTTADASPDGGAASSSSSSSSSSGSTGSSSGGLPDGGPRPADDAGVTADGGVDPPGAGPGGDTKTIVCGATTCPIPAETCCVSEVAANGENAYACNIGTTCPRPAGGGDTAALKCSGAANCAAGTVCCVSENNGRAASECKPSCGAGEAQLCDPKAGDAGGCPPARPCSNDNIADWGELPPSYGTCGGRGT